MQQFLNSIYSVQGRKGIDDFGNELRSPEKECSVDQIKARMIE